MNNCSKFMKLNIPLDPVCKIFFTFLHTYQILIASMSFNVANMGTPFLMIFCSKSIWRIFFLPYLKRIIFIGNSISLSSTASPWSLRSIDTFGFFLRQFFLIKMFKNTMKMEPLSCTCIDIGVNTRPRNSPNRG